MKRRYDNRWLVLFIVLALIVLLGVTGHTQEALAAWTGKVTATSLNVRAEPSTTAQKVQLNDTYVYLVKDETVTILEETGDFYYISMKFNGKTVKGYVHKDFIKVTERPKASPTPTPKPSVTPKPTKAPTATPKPGKTPTTTPKPTAEATPTRTPSSGESVAIKTEVKLKASIIASSLNVRSGPGTTYSKVASLGKGNSVTVLSKVTENKEEWYAISFSDNGNTTQGYVLSAYVKLSYGSGIQGTTAEKLKIRSTASSKAAYVKDKKGNILSLAKKTAVTILDETIVSGVKWFKITVTVSEKKYTGYVEASRINFKVTEKQAKPTPSATPSPSNTPTPSPKPTPDTAPTPGATPTETPKPTDTPNSGTAPSPTAVISPTPLPTLTLTPTPTPSPTPDPASYLQISNNPVLASLSTPVNGFVCNIPELNIVHNLAGFENILDANNQPIMLKNAQKVLVTQVSLVDGIAWYQVTLDNGIYGYVMGQYIYIGNSIPSGSAPSVMPTITPIPTPAVDYNKMDFEAKLAAEGFPESYKTALRSLHALYPNWEFRAYHTGLDWKTVIDAESVYSKNLIPNSKSVEWKSLDSGAYNWETDTFIVFDGSTWVTASREAIEYYMDPRNFLSANSIFQFELLKYQSEYQNLAGVENILKGTAMYNTSYSYVDENGVTKTITYAETFIKAAEYSGVSPYHLASRVKQEVVTGPSTLSGSVSGTYSGYEGLYNFYNIGANDSAGGGAIAKGLKFAKNGSGNANTDFLFMIPWTNPYRSIVGGSYFIGGSYINRGQDTIYLQKFNVTPISTYYHQYMTNVEAPYAEGKKVAAAYSGMTDSPIVFSIPVYLNMPETPAPLPTTKFNPNNRMKSLKITDLDGNELKYSPTFGQTVYDYYLIVPATVNTVQISASTVSKKAVISGGGKIALNTGNNTVVVSVIAEDGSTANYTINIVRES